MSVNSPVREKIAFAIAPPVSAMVMPIPSGNTMALIIAKRTNTEASTPCLAAIVMSKLSVGDLSARRDSNPRAFPCRGNTFAARNHSPLIETGKTVYRPDRNRTRWAQVRQELNPHLMGLEAIALPLSYSPKYL